MLCMITTAGTVLAQLSNAPVLITPPNVQYPPIARAAHVSGDVVVSFSIDSEGHTVSVQTQSGHPMLRSAVEGQIKQWRFKTPLPMNAQQDFEATYKFDLKAGEENLDDDLDAPPYMPCCRDSINLVVSPGQVTGEVRSLDGSQSIDVAAVAVSITKDRCPDDKERQPPTATSPADFVELYRTGCNELECRNYRNYRVRVFRNGRVEWYGKEGVALNGNRVAVIRPEIAASLLDRFQSSDYWAACSAQPPSPDADADADDFTRGDFLTVSIDGHTKSTEVSSYSSFSSEGVGMKFAWSVDRAADTHRWRHGDSATEPYTNMRDDIVLPKPGMTALIRAVYRFNPSNAELTLEPLKHFIAAGADLNAADESGWTALMYATNLAYFDDRAVRLLLEAHADVNRASLHGDTALMMAAYHGLLNKELLAAGANINACNGDGVTTLMLLAQGGRPDELANAIAAGADATAHDLAGHNALDYLIAAACHKPFVPLPADGMVVIPKEPPACPDQTAYFLRTQAMLKTAMEKGAKSAAP
jgi:TonB family protein